METVGEGEGGLLSDLFRALGSVLYGAGSMSDSFRDYLLLKPDSLLLTVSMNVYINT